MLDFDPNAPLSAPPAGPVPECDIDLFAPDAIKDPDDAYRQVRDAGPVVWLPRLGVFALARYDQVKAALENWEVFASTGPSLNHMCDAGLRGTTLTSDPPLHDHYRRILGEPLSPRGLREYKDLMATRATEAVEAVMRKDSFEGVSELCSILPLEVVRSLVGLPPEGQAQMLKWGEIAFDSMGPLNPRTEAALREVLNEIQFVTAPDLPERVDPDGWAARIFNAAKAGEIKPEQCPAMVLDYINPSLDTTIAGMAALLFVFGENPDQWDLLRANHGLIPNAINEAVRWMSPIRFFARIVRKQIEIEGITLPEGARVLVMYGAANRDERRWDNPDKFDINRSVAGHLGFGAGIHACMGQNLARLEIRSVLEAMLPRVRRIEVSDVVLAETHILRQFQSMTVRFVPA